MVSDVRRNAPAAARNRDPILGILRRHLPELGLILEVASGTGEHVVHFAAAMPGLTFQPSDPPAEARSSTDAWVREMRLPNVRAAIELDVTPAAWPIDEAAGLICINMIHIAPWPATEGMLRGASSVLPAGGPLVLYGPFREGGRHTALSNQAFDKDLRLRNPNWGMRGIEDVAQLASSMGFSAPEIEHMPANNLVLVFCKH